MPRNGLVGWKGRTGREASGFFWASISPYPWIPKQDARAQGLPFFSSQKETVGSPPCLPWRLTEAFMVEEPSVSSIPSPQPVTRSHQQCRGDTKPQVKHERPNKSPPSICSNGGKAARLLLLALEVVWFLNLNRPCLVFWQFKGLKYVQKSGLAKV